MITIKKVAVTPLPENEGKIIDSFDTTDDKRTNAPSARATKDYIDTSVNTIINSKILSGTADPSSSLGQDGDIYFQYES